MDVKWRCLTQSDTMGKTILGLASLCEFHCGRATSSAMVNNLTLDKHLIDCAVDFMA